MLIPAPWSLFLAKRRRCGLLRSLASSASPNGAEGVDNGAGGGGDFGVRIWGHGTKGQLGVPKEDVSNCAFLIEALGCVTETMFMVWLF